MTDAQQIVNLSHPDGHDRFLDTKTGVEMSREEFIARIHRGEYPGYFAIAKNGGIIPSSSPDGDRNNLD